MKCLIVSDMFECSMVEDTDLGESDYQAAENGEIAIVRWNDERKKFEQLLAESETIEPDDPVEGEEVEAEAEIKWDIKWEIVL